MSDCFVCLHSGLSAQKVGEADRMCCCCHSLKHWDLTSFQTSSLGNATELTRAPTPSSTEKRIKNLASHLFHSGRVINPSLWALRCSVETVLTGVCTDAS